LNWGRLPKDSGFFGVRLAVSTTKKALLHYATTPFLLRGSPGWGRNWLMTSGEVEILKILVKGLPLAVA